MKLADVKMLKKVPIYQIKVTPEVAEELMGINYKNNRKIVSKKLEQYKEDMLSGRWDSSIVDPIRIEINEMTDEWVCMYSGQHRLRAIIESGVTVPIWVDLTAKESQYLNLDNGASRRDSDYIHMQHAQHITALSVPVYKTMYAYNISAGVSTILHGKNPPSRNSKVDIVNKYENELQDAVRIGLKIRTKLKGGSVKAFSFFAWAVVYLNINDCLEDYVEDFTQQYSNALPVRAAQSALVYSKGTGITEERYFGTLMYSYLRYRLCEEPKRISWQKGNEEFLQLLEQKKQKMINEEEL